MTDEFEGDPVGAGLHAVRKKLGHEAYRKWLLTPSKRAGGRCPMAVALADDTEMFTDIVCDVFVGRLEEADDPTIVEKKG